MQAAANEPPIHKLDGSAGAARVAGGPATAAAYARRVNEQANSISVDVATESDAAAWDAYIDRHRAATVFHRWAWRQVLSEAFSHRPHFLIARRGRTVVGVLPLVEVKSLLFGHSLSSLPFCPYAGPLADDNEAHVALDSDAVARAVQLRVDHLQYRILPGRQEPRRDWPKQDIYVAFRKTLSADHEANLNAIPRKQRAMVRKGIKAGLSADAGDLDTFFELFADNVHRHGTPAHHRRYFALLLEAFGENAEILIVRDPAGVPVSGVLSLYFRDEVLPLHAGDIARSRELAANDFKYWSLMRRAVDRGCTVFDYGRSKRGTGPYDFKKNWGFEPTQLDYEYRLVRGQAIPEHNPLNPKYRLMIEAWRRMPRWFVNAAGPLIVRGLG